jgi:plasmid stabilization system protein ParE
LLSENFLIEAAYRAKDLGVLPPEFKAKHTYFEIHDSTSREEMKNNLDVPRILGLITPAEVAQRLPEKQRFGRTEFYAETRYGSDAVRAAFLKPQGRSASVEHFEAVGRSALGALLMDDEGQDFRKRVAQDDALWQELKRNGNRANFAPLFGLPAGSSDPRVEAAGADFTAITSWAEAMAGTARALEAVDQLLSRNGNLSQAQSLLRDHLAEVVTKTRDEFGDPLGMVMFYIAANQDAERIALITGEGVQPLERRSDDGLAAGARN